MHFPEINGDFPGSTNGRSHAQPLSYKQDGRWTPASKVLLDYLIIFPALMLLFPLLAFLSLLVFVNSPGPILQWTPALGKNGRIFHVYKFRTRYLPKHSERTSEAATNQRPPTTAVGRWLQQRGLDELPQLFNILKGDMSLVGPRLITPAELERYDRYQSMLLSVKPGLTGLWQLSGRYDLTHQDRVRVEINYIRNWSLWLDIKILMLTPAAARQLKNCQ